MFLGEDQSKVIRGVDAEEIAAGARPQTKRGHPADGKCLKSEEPTRTAEGTRIISSERATPAESIELVFPADRVRRVVRIRVVLAQHLDKIFILPSGRRLPIDALMDRLASGRYDWAEGECELCYDESVDPCDETGPWAAPDCAPCWTGVQGPLFHLWATRGTPPRRELVGLIVPDQRTANRSSQIETFIQEVGLDADETMAGAPSSQPRHEIELSNLIVESAYRPALAETDPAILALSKPEEEGWTPGWWKLGMLSQWQYGWSRWK